MTTAFPVTEAAEPPFFDDLRVGQVEEGAPALTLTDGHAALRQAILGDRLRLALDSDLCSRVLGAEGTLAHPGLVCDVAIGQSTLLTQRVIGNLFYRGLILRRAPRIGDTLRTTTEVLALRQNRPRRGRAATGMAVLRILTRDQEGRAVLDFRRCAMLPQRDPETVDVGRLDAIEEDDARFDARTLAGSVAGWNLDAFREVVAAPHVGQLTPGVRWIVPGGDVVSCAPELARLSLNVASVHHDAPASGGRRLVYGGHTIGIAAAQLTRVLPGLVTIVAWHSCDHLGPVFEGDTLRSEVTLCRVEALATGGWLVHLRSRVRAYREGVAVDVLDWRLAGVMA